mmetsp:Transcript_2860/g.5250  ORF Transcript_2860/g.5250 Transcript_2860/m.5250 type:complete len:346 (-) Transcript_2860:331-1368(-)
MKRASKAFLFMLSRSSISFTHKMKLKSANSKAVYHHSSCGPVFGNGKRGCYDLQVNGAGKVTLCLGQTYESDPSGRFSSAYNHTIKEMEVYQVITGTSNTQSKNPVPQKQKVVEVNSFSKDINDAINGRWASLQEAEDELEHLEKSFKDERTFIKFFAKGQPQDVVTLNVCGTTMLTRLSTLHLCKESALSSKFSSEYEKHQSNRKAIKEWNYEDVVAWLNKLDGIPDSVVKEFEDNQVTGRELLALGAEGLKDFGVARKGTIYLLLDEIKKLQMSDNDTETLIEHSPYCFEKILDHLRLETWFTMGLVKTKHGLPVVRASEKTRYDKVLRHLFPGESSKIFLSA